jgi:FkbM family methyltransferase
MTAYDRSPDVRADSAWEPPLKLEERLKALLPADSRIRYLYRRNLRIGEPELKMAPFLADKRRVSIDVGANKGVYSYAMLPHSRAVHAFEPNPKLFRMLSSWGEGRISLHREALSNVTGAAELLVPRSAHGYSNQGASLSAIKVGGDHSVVHIKSARLDDMGITDIGFIKIDVEGFEKEVLQGAAETLKRDRPNLLIEMEELHTKTPLAEMIAGVCAYGYRAFVLSNGTLTPLERIDMIARHAPGVAREDYLFNFIFLPD